MAWVLNLDAEHELEGGERYQPSRHLAALVARERRRLIGTLVAPGDVVLDELPGPSDERARGLIGIAWSPTPRALARLAAAGSILPAAPPPQVLAAVNARPFASQVRAPLAQDAFEKHLARDLDQALACLSRPAPDGWLVRRTFGAAGRGRRRLFAGRPDAAERAWLEAGLRRGPLVVEPWVRVRREYSRNAWLEPGGALVIAAPSFQHTTAHGAWTRSEEAAPSLLARGDDARLEQAIAAAGAALAAAGYFGPFGIDAYRYLDADGRERLNPMSEINARYTMDYARELVGPIASSARTLPGLPERRPVARGLAGG